MTAAAIGGSIRCTTLLCTLLSCLAFHLLGLAAPASAQSAGAGGVWEVGGGGLFLGGYDLGRKTAELTPNTGNNPVTLFTTSNKVRPVFGVQARIGYVVSEALAIEVGLRFARPTYEARVTEDFENAADTTIEESLSEYVFEGSALWHFTGAGFAGGRAVPFAFGGVGYMRELHDGDVLVEDGIEYHAGLGLKWWFSDRRRGFGIRGDGGISIRDGAFDFKDGRRIVPMASGSLIYRF